MAAAYCSRVAARNPDSARGIVLLQGNYRRSVPLALFELGMSGAIGRVRLHIRGRRGIPVGIKPEAAAMRMAMTAAMDAVTASAMRMASRRPVAATRHGLFTRQGDQENGRQRQR